MTEKSYHPPYTITTTMLNLVAEISEKLGRLWQTLILTKWHSLFADIPVESLIYEKQKEYYQALKLSTDKADSAPFIEFMLHRVMESLTRVTPQVKKLLEVAQEEMAALEIQGKLNLKDRKSFRLHYLDPAMRAGVIEMTIPERPNSRLQKYRLTELGRMVTQK